MAVISLSLPRPALVTSPMLQCLVEAVSENSALNCLFPPHPAPCRVAVSCIKKLLEMIVPLLRSTHQTAVWQSKSHTVH